MQAVCGIEAQLVVSGTAYRKPKDQLQSYYITMQIEQRKGWKIHWLIRGCSFIIPPMISEFRANFLAKNFHEIRGGAFPIYNFTKWFFDIYFEKKRN